MCFCVRQAHARLRALKQQHEELVRANLERMNGSTQVVDKATEAAAGAAEGLRLKRATQRRNELRVSEIGQELEAAPATERTLLEVSLQALHCRHSSALRAPL
jgi:hypothetical protein